MFTRRVLWPKNLKQYLYVRNVDMRVPNGWDSASAARGTAL